MYPHEYYNARQKIDLQRNIVKRSALGSESFSKEFGKYINFLIAVRGHSLCMDVASERKRMSKLVTSAVGEFLK